MKESLGTKTWHFQGAELEILVITEGQAGGYYSTADNSYGFIQSEAVNITVRSEFHPPTVQSEVLKVGSGNLWVMRTF